MGSAWPAFWQSTLGGVVIGAGLGLLSNVVVWLIATSRDDRIEARRTRRDSGIECLRFAYRLREACTRLLAINSVVRSAQPPSEEVLADQEQCWAEWDAAARAFGEQIHVARASADPDVWAWFAMIGQWETQHMVGRSMPDSGGAEGGDGAFVQQLDDMLGILADKVSIDARVHVGLRGRWRNRIADWTRPLRDWWERLGHPPSRGSSENPSE